MLCREDKLVSKEAEADTLAVELLDTIERVAEELPEILELAEVVIEDINV